MRFYYAVLAALVSAPVLPAVQVPEESPFVRKVDENQAAIDECIAAMEAVLTTYEGIQDTSSADAAAARLEGLHRRMEKAVDRVNAIGEADAATQNLFMTKLLPMLFVNAARTKMAVERIQTNDYYGSVALRQFMEVTLVPQE